MKKIILFLFTILFSMLLANSVYAQSSSGEGAGIDPYGSGAGAGINPEGSGVGEGIGDTIGGTSDLGDNTTSGSSGSSSSLNAYINNIYKYAQGIGFGLATLVLIYAGYLYATSGGNPEQIGLAKEYMIGALAGYAFLLMAVLIYNAINVGGGGGDAGGLNWGAEGGATGGIENSIENAGEGAGTISGSETAGGASNAGQDASGAGTSGGSELNQLFDSIPMQIGEEF